MGRAFCDYLSEHGRNDSHTAITREAVESYLADMNDRVAPATTAKH